MKACISTLIGICVLFNAGSSHAQCPSNKRQLDVAVTQGFVTESQAFKSINNNPDEQQTYSSGTTFITVRYFLYNRLAIGLAGGITKENNRFA